MLSFWGVVNREGKVIAVLPLLDAVYLSGEGNRDGKKEYL